MKAAGALIGLRVSHARLHVEDIRGTRSGKGYTFLLLSRNNARLTSFTLVMPGDPKTNEWNLLKDQFDALVRNEGVRQGSLEQALDYEILRRFGEVIASVGDQTKRIYGASLKSDYATWPPEPGRAKL